MCASSAQDFAKLQILVVVRRHIGESCEDVPTIPPRSMAQYLSTMVADTSSLNSRNCRGSCSRIHRASWESAPAGIKPGSQLRWLGAGCYAAVASFTFAQHFGVLTVSYTVRYLFGPFSLVPRLKTDEPVRYRSTAGSILATQHAYRTL